MSVPHVNIRVTKSGQTRGVVRIKGGKVHVPIRKPIVLGLYETRMIVPPYEISGNGLKTVVGTSKVLHLLVSVLLRETSEVGIQVFNFSNESKYLSYKLTLVGIILYPGTIVKWDRTIKQQEGVAIHIIKSM